jgi:hypothetical protein
MCTVSFYYEYYETMFPFLMGGSQLGIFFYNNI